MEPIPATAVLVVHGIGNQKPGETLRTFLQSLCAVPDAEIDQSGVEPGTAVLHWRGRTLRFYEVFWADILEGAKTQGSFETTDPQLIAWFPWFNFWRGVYDRRDYSAWLVMAWTAVLVPLSLCWVPLYYGARVITDIVYARDRRPPSIRESFSRLKILGSRQRRTRRRTWLDDVLDEFIGDALNYAYSLGGVLPPGSSHADCALEILGRFDRRMADAARDGCREIHIVSHSLGSVVMYHALARHRWDEDPWRLVRGIYTFGSPLEKVGFLWPLLMERSPVPNPALRWHNACDTFDFVAGSLKRFNDWTGVRNHRMWGLGGAARAHTMYQDSPAFQDLITEGLLGTAYHSKVSRARRAAQSFLETVIFVVVLSIAAAGGALIILLVAAIIPCILSLPLYVIGRHSSAVEVLCAGTRIAACLILFVLCLTGLLRARDFHRQMLANAKSSKARYHGIQ